VLLATALAVLVWQDAAAPTASRFEATSLTFAATLLSLAILEHWFLVLPLPSEALWSWVLRERERSPPKNLGAKPL
jgi:putative photosynthetic complex assembly protein 2